MQGRWRRAALWFGIGTAALTALALVVFTVVVSRPGLLRPLLTRALAPTGGSASLAGLELTLRPLSLRLDGLTMLVPGPQGDRLRLDHLRIETSAARLLRRGPWVERVEARGLSFERSAPGEAKGPPDLTPLKWLFRIETLVLSDVRFQIPLAGGSLTGTSLRLSLTPAGEGAHRLDAGGELSFGGRDSGSAAASITVAGRAMPGPSLDLHLSLGQARLELPWVAGDALGRGVLRLTPKELQVQEVSLDLAEARVRASPGTAWQQGAIRLRAAGKGSLKGADLRLEVGELSVAGLFRGRGSVAGPSLEQLSGSFEGDVPDLGRLSPLLAPHLPSRLQGLALEGALPFRVRLKAGRASPSLAAELFPRAMGLSLPNLGLGGRFDGVVRIEGAPEAWRKGRATLDGRVQGGGQWVRQPVAVQSFRVDVPLAGELSAPRLTGWRVSAAAGTMSYEGRLLPLGKLDLLGNALGEQGVFRLEKLELSSESLGRLTGGVTFDSDGARGVLSGQGLPASGVVALAGAAFGRDWRRWSSAGAVDLNANLEAAEGQPRLSGAVALRQVGFSSPNGEVLGQNLTARLDVSARSGPEVAAKADFRASQGEALWGTLYVNLAQHPLELHTGLRRSGPGELRDLFLTGGLSGFGRLEARGEARRTAGGWRHGGRATLSDARLGPLFQTFVRDPMAPSHPGLQGLAMDGNARVELSFSGRGNTADLKGRVSVQSAGLRREKDQPLLSGLELELPVAYALGSADPGRPRPGSAAGWGRMTAKSLRIGDQELGPLVAAAAVVPNRLYLKGEVRVPLFGGSLTLKGIEVEQPASPAFAVNLEALVDRIDLGRLPGTGELLKGTLSGLFDPVRLTRERMTAAGALRGELWGGRVEISRLTAERPFSPGREMGADVDVSLLDLEQLSAAAKVGRITGRVSGSLKSLRVAYGQPVGLQLKMESVTTKGVPQLVSLKAVNSISLLSTGSTLGGLGLSVMTTVFREFPYAKIGFECGLENDVFTVRGLIREGGVEYLVKRPLLSGINVINRNPDNRISFSDMLDRLKRVSGQGAP